jgi:nucleoside-diphosphate-sugar epimerase
MNEAMSVAVTGANGFVGRALAARLGRGGGKVRRLVRVQTTADEIGVGDLGVAPVGLDVALEGVTTVVHLAARAHIMKDTSTDPRTAFRASNVDGTRRLAEAAVAAGVKRFVFVSTVKVHGEHTEIGRPFRADSAYNPCDDYALSKVEAEQALGAFGTDLDVVTLRPPLIYGPGVRANFQLLIDAVRRGVPLPLASVTNERSLLGLSNLCAAVEAVIGHPDHLSRPFLLSDGIPVSTPDLIREIARVLGKKANLMPFPVPLLRAVARVIGRAPMIDRLCDSLAVDNAAICAVLGWKSEFDLENGLREMIAPA